MKTIVVIPAFNEALKINRVVAGVRAQGRDVVVINDASSDATASEAKSAGAGVLNHFTNRGYGAALTTGNVWALRQGYDILVHFDGDDQHHAADIEKLIEPIKNGQVDVALGSRFLQTNSNVPVLRRLLLKAAIYFTWLVSGLKLTDAHNGLRAFSRQALQKIDCRQDGMSYASEIIDQIAEHKLRHVEVPVTVVYTDYSRAKGESNIKKVLLGLKFLWGKIVR